MAGLDGVLALTFFNKKDIFHFKNKYLLMHRGKKAFSCYKIYTL